MKNMFNVTTVLPHNLLQTKPCIRHNFSTQVFRNYIFWPPKEARKFSAAQGLDGEVVQRAFWALGSKSCDECKVSYARGFETKRWSHWTCSSLGTIFQPMRINSVPDVKCFLIIKMCYVHNQWYDISCATLYNFMKSSLLVFRLGGWLLWYFHTSLFNDKFKDISKVLILFNYL